MTASPAGQPQRLPPGWKWARLRNLCVQDRVTIPAADITGENLPYIGGEHIERNSGRILFERYRVPNQSMGISNTFKFDSRHVLYSKLRPYLNKVALPGFSGRCSTELIPLLPHEVDKTYLAFFLRLPATVAYAMQGSTGSRMPRTDMPSFMNLPIPLAPLVEQKRIVAILNEQMAAVDRAKKAATERLEAAQALREALVERVFDEVRDRKWPEIHLGGLGDIVSGITLGRKLRNDSMSSVRPYLRVANVKDGYLDLNEVKEIAVSSEECAKYLLKKGDLLLTEGGDPDKLGRGCVWSEEIPNCLHQNHIFRIRLHQERINPRFASLQVGSHRGKSYFFNNARQTTGIATINRRILEGFPMILPPISEQDAAVGMLDRATAEWFRLNGMVRQSADSAEAMPAALLRQAFAGKL